MNDAPQRNSPRNGPHDRPRDVPRYLPHVEWPAYAYLPGRDPHPIVDARGHSYGERESTHEPLDPSDWSASDLYLRGADLYNHGYQWEAHEAWEALWHSAYDPVQHTYLQGLIQIAAAAVQQRLGHEPGRMRLTRRAVGRLRTVHEEHGAFYMGVHLPPLVLALEDYAATLGPPPLLWLRF